MSPRSVPRLAPCFAAALLITAAPSAAQPRERGSLSIVSGALTASADLVTGTIPTVGVAASIPIQPWIDLESEFAVATGTLRREYTGWLTSFAPFGSPRDVVEANAVITRTINERKTDWLFSIGVLLHSSRSAWRVRPQLYLGLTGHQVVDHTRLEHLVLPPGVTLAEVEQRLPPQPPRHRNLGGPTAGIGVVIALTDRLAVVPDLRYDYGSIGDEINNALRSTVRVRWRF
jgi:hypothetical protein